VIGLCNLTTIFLILGFFFTLRPFTRINFWAACGTVKMFISVKEMDYLAEGEEVVYLYEGLAHWLSSLPLANNTAKNIFLNHLIRRTYVDKSTLIIQVKTPIDTAVKRFMSRDYIHHYF